MIRHKRGKTGEANIVVSIKMPEGLRDRIDTLSQKGLITRNRWIVKALARDARYSSKPYNPESFYGLYDTKNIPAPCKRKGSQGVTEGG